MPFEEDLSKAKENLKSILGDSFQIYMENMKKWFKGKLSKQEFDLETKKIISINSIHFHNEFLLCIIRKCHNFASIGTSSYVSSLKENTDYLLYDETNLSLQCQQQFPRTPTIKKSKLSDTQQNKNSFIPADLMKLIPKPELHDLNMMSKQAFHLKNLEFCSSEHSLPYVRMIHNRLLLSILELNIDYTDLNCIYLIVESTIYFLKNILTKLIDHHKLANYKLPINLKNQKIQQKFYGKNFYYDDYAGKYDVETTISDGDDADEDKKREINDLNYMKEYSSRGLSNFNQFINLYDLKRVLESDKSLIPSHTINTINLEKIICNLNHENMEENKNAENFE